MRNPVLTFGSILLLFFCFDGVFAQRDAGHLRGLTGVVVEVGGNFNDLSKDGLYEFTIQVDIELQLRKAGITVVPKNRSTLTTPTLYAFVDALKISDDYYVCNMRLELIEDAIVIRDRSRAAATSWGRIQMIRVRTNNMRKARDWMIDITDAFANDYLAANPK
jgi:hypothetical protein